MDEIRNPIHLLCPKCGAPTEYSVETGYYRCPYCGTMEPPQERLRRVMNWRSMRRADLRAQLPESGAAVCVCPGCGAQVMLPETEATGVCDFCGGTLTRRAFAEQEDFPALILPFTLTLLQAREALLAWARKNGKKEEREAVEQSVDALQGYYLPYQFVRGPVQCSVSRDASQRRYQCGGYVNEIAINASKNLRNEVLDAVEPFQWDAAQPFHFGYLAGQRAKLPDITGPELEQRVREEVEHDYLPVVEKTMYTRGVSVNVTNGALEELPVLLPVYVISRPGLCVAVNGQTGAVAMTLGKTVDAGRFWFIEPTLTTLAVFLVGWLFTKVVGMELMFAAVAGAIAFVAFGQNRSSHDRLVVSGTDVRGDKGGKRAVPVFWEWITDHWEAVKIRFYPPGRVMGLALGVLAFNVLPLLVAMAIQAARGLPVRALDFRYLGLWLVISVPFSFIYWIAFLRRDIFDRPVLYRLAQDGGTQRIRGAGGRFSVGTVVKTVFALGKAALLLVGLPLIMFIMSVVLMLKLA